MHSGNATPVSGILPDITETPRRHETDSKADSAILGGPQARWSDSTTSEVEYEAGDVSRRHETTNLFDVRHGEEDHDGQIGDSSAVRKRNAKLDNMF